MIPNHIKFTDGQHKGLTFTRGKGPVRSFNLSGIIWEVNSPELWYGSYGGNFLPNRCVDAAYLKQNWQIWVKA